MSQDEPPATKVNMTRSRVGEIRREAFRQLPNLTAPVEAMDMLYNAHARVMGNAFRTRAEREASFNTLLNRLGRPDDPRLNWPHSNTTCHYGPNHNYVPPAASLADWLAAPLRTLAHVESWLLGQPVAVEWGWPKPEAPPTERQRQRALYLESRARQAEERRANAARARANKEAARAKLRAEQGLAALAAERAAAPALATAPVTTTPPATPAAPATSGNGS